MQKKGRRRRTNRFSFSVFLQTYRIFRQSSHMEPLGLPSKMLHFLATDTLAKYWRNVAPKWHWQHPLHIYYYHSRARIRQGLSPFSIYNIYIYIVYTPYHCIYSPPIKPKWCFPDRSPASSLLPSPTVTPN